MLITPATMREISRIKYPCTNQSRFVIRMSNKEYSDKSFTLLVLYVLYNCGYSWMQFTIGANVATIKGSIYIYIYNRQVK